MSGFGRRIRVRGTVQGVGFRPWVYRLAHETGIGGRVRNDSQGVTIEVFGGEPALDEFVQRLRSRAPSPANIRELSATKIPNEQVHDFIIEPSAKGGDRSFSIPPDLATCPACMAEVLDPHNRRHRYPFTNCTHCGPRFTIATDVPYDRPATTMASFAMCESCQREYDSVADRRFHAQPNACPACGPSLTLLTANADGGSAAAPLASTAALLRDGAIVAIKGLGGFHLACDAEQADVVARLRSRKRRDEKPFAVMVCDLSAARQLAALSDEEETLLSAPERPIVLVERRVGAPVALNVAPDTDLLGLFLPYTPLHLLLLNAIGKPLVMTSANISEEPICSDNDEALRRLTGIADAWLLHDRDIATRCDDSVTRVIAGHPTILRRSRGYVPRAIPLSKPVVQPVLACGAHLKNTFCLAAGDSAYLGPHIGDLENTNAFDFYERAIERMQRILQIEPEVIAHDLHPAYLSTKYAVSRAETIRVSVQHHHAHVASAMTEHGLRGPVIGVAYDGTGYGTDGTSWGGEFLLADFGRFERLGSFRPIALPGSDVAMREVWRIALSALHDALEGDTPDDLSVFDAIPESSLNTVRRMVDVGFNTPAARGVGRYFDAVGAIVLGRPISKHEGQVAITLDRIADVDERGAYDYAVDRSTDVPEIDLRPTLRAIVSEYRAGVSAATISARFHNALVNATVTMVRETTQGMRLPVVLTGGVFQNSLLAARIHQELHDLEIYLHGEVPPGDGGIALGQAVIADALVRAGNAIGGTTCA